MNLCSNVRNRDGGLYQIEEKNCVREERNAFQDYPNSLDILEIELKGW